MRLVLLLMLLSATGCAAAPHSPAAHPQPARSAFHTDQACADRCLLDSSQDYSACLASCPGSAPRPVGGCRNPDGSYVRCSVMAEHRQREQTQRAIAASLDTVADTLELVETLSTLAD